MYYFAFKLFSKIFSSRTHGYKTILPATQIAHTIAMTINKDQGQIFLRYGNIQLNIYSYTVSRITFHKLRFNNI